MAKKESLWKRIVNSKVIRYLREMVGELKKLTWLSGKELVSHTLAVFVFVLVMAAMIYVLDLIYTGGFNLIERISIG